MKTNINILLAIFLNISIFVDAALYLTNSNISTVVEITEETCQVLFDSEEITGLLEKEQENFNIISDEELVEIQQSCMLSPRFNIFGNERYGLIYPGTLWCGRGNKAANYTQLGIHSREDSCCREHDNCPSSITAGECRGGVCNKSSYTRSHCECDRKFQECLRASGTETGNLIGAIYFNVVQIFCFREIPKCPPKMRIADNGTRTITCPFEFLEAQKYRFTEPMFTWRNSKAFLINTILRNIWT